MTGSDLPGCYNSIKNSYLSNWLTKSTHKIENNICYGNLLSFNLFLDIFLIQNPHPTGAPPAPTGLPCAKWPAATVAVCLPWRQSIFLSEVKTGIGQSTLN